MKSKLLLAVLFLLPAIGLADTAQLFLTNQYGEQSLNWVQGTVVPMPAVAGSANNLVLASGTITPTSATLVDVAGTGSLYINRNPYQNNSAKLFMNVGTVTAPSWRVIGP